MEKNRRGWQEPASWQEAAQKVAELTREKYLNHMPKAYVHSYGCQENVSDGERLKGMCLACGFGLTDTSEGADLVLFNTCAVREHAEDRVYGNLGALSHEKRRNPNLIVGVCGCMTEQEHVAEKIKMSFPLVDFVFGSSQPQTLPYLLLRRMSGGRRQFPGPTEQRPILEDLPVRRDHPFKAFVPVMYGCNNFCSYCIVPYVRGRERSRNVADVEKEVRSLVESGYREITLLGQNVNSYGRGAEDGVDFPALLRRLDQIEGDWRMRFISSHPKDATDDLFEAMAEGKHICHALHLPVQSGNDAILKAMNRRYTAEKYLSLVEKAKKLMPDLTLSTDLIVGFPGEDEAAFQDTLSLVKAVRYAQLFTFIYSPRNGTAAVRLDDPFTHAEKADRMARLLKVQEQIGFEDNQALVGKTLRVLIEGPGKSADGMLSGRTEGNRICEFPACGAEPGQFVQVKIKSAFNWAVTGEIV